MERAHSYSRFSSKRTVPESMPTSSVSAPSSAPAQAPPKKEIDTNFFEVNLNCLKVIPSLSTGDPISCNSCGCFYNSSSQVDHSKSPKIWECEFCSHPNPVQIEIEEQPSQSEQNYMLEDRRVNNTFDTENISSLETTSVIFCMDISGSMCLKKQIQKDITIELAGATLGKLSKISRLQCMQAAVDNQLKTIRLKYPNKRVGLVSFNNMVQIIGDGTITDSIPKAISENFSDLMDFSQNQRGKFINQPISSSFDQLRSKIMSLGAKGGTALGPALLFSIILASEAGPGSQVIICTDGLANIGVGDLTAENVQDEFYREVGSIAKELGVSVSVITIEGQDCKLEALNFVTFETQGDIVKVAPEALVGQFEEIMSQEVIATNVAVEILLHKSIEFHNEKPKFLTNDGSTLKKFIGNANDATSFSFQYALKSDEKLSNLQVSKESLHSIPIQATFRFKGPDGRRYLKVITKVQKVVFDQEIDLKELNQEVLMRAGRRAAVKLVEEGKLEEARVESLAWREVALMNDEEKGREFLRDMDTIECNIGIQLEKGLKGGLTDDFVVMNQMMKLKK